jgi:hypothetical protein
MNPHQGFLDNNGFAGTRWAGEDLLTIQPSMADVSKTP